MKRYIIIILAFIIILPATLTGQKSETGSKKKISITGIVTDANRNPVAGAMILIDKKNTNVVTDSKGYYKVKVRPGAVKISAFTFKSGNADMVIDGRTTVNITLSGSQNSDLKAEEPGKRVEIGYGSIEKSNLTNQVSQVEGEKNKYASYSNIYDMLRGTVPGLQVRGKSITIQGISSNNPNSEPLLVVDGQIVSSIDYLIPTEVKSIEVLKGASASIYGSRGANGVLLIKLISGPERK